MSKKEMIKVQLAQIDNLLVFHTPLKDKLIRKLKEVAREVLTLADDEEVFSVRLIER